MQSSNALAPPADGARATLALRPELILVVEHLCGTLRVGRSNPITLRDMVKRQTPSINVQQQDIFEPSHINRQIPPEAHTAMYVWHKYWSRKTWNVVSEHIKAYSPEAGIVFDPFAGSGVVAIEAARSKRRAIVCDLNPVANYITEITLLRIKPERLYEAFEGVRDRAMKAIRDLYAVHCLKCGKSLVADCFVRRGDKVTEVRYKGCPHCGHRSEGSRPKKRDIELLEALESGRIRDWYPRNPLKYPDGAPFKERQQYKSLDELFTKRNLRAVAMLYAAIQDENSPSVRKVLMGGFTSMIHLCTRMMPVGTPAPSNHYTYFSSRGWTQHSYWSASEYMEQNAWDKFEGAITGHQGLINAMVESSKELDDVKVTNDWRKVLAGEADIAVVTDDCIELMKKMPEESIDYIFTDPPYDASVQYGELSYLWNAWLKEDYRYTETMVAHEIVRNEKQGKPFEVYNALLNNSFKGFYRVLKPERWLTLTFHNPTFRIRNATVRGGIFAGFNYEHIHHQPLGQVSAKSMLQPFGSARGDFYLRFARTAAPTRKMEEVTEDRFRRIVVETCKEVIAMRAEPTPYTILVNQVDPVLAKQGLFGTLQTGLDVKTVLEESLAVC